MGTLKLNEDHDIALVNNRPVIATGADEVEQRLRCNLKLFLGEFFLDQSVGTPWRQVIFEKATPPETIAAAIKSVILATPGVVQLRSYSQSIDARTRELSVSFEVLSTDGEIVLEVLAP